MNIASIASGLTLGIAPIYWYSPVRVTVDVRHQGNITQSYQYKSGIHYLYGHLWTPLLPVESINEIPIFYVSTGMHAQETFTNKAIGKTMTKLDLDGDTDQACRVVVELP